MKEKDEITPNNEEKGFVEVKDPNEPEPVLVNDLVIKEEGVEDLVTNEKKEKKKFKLNPEIKGMIGIFLVIFILGFIMAASTGKFEQWFGIDITGAAKITNKIIYIEEGDKNKIVTYDVVTGKTKTILEQADIKDVSIAPTGKKVAFVGYEGEKQEVFIMNPDGKKIKSITKIEGSKAKPKFSPNGKYLAYIANGRVFRADLNGSNAFSVLPTRQEQQNALNGRDGKLVMKDFVWSNTGEGMLGVVARSDEDERLVIMNDNNGDAHEVPFPDDMKCKFISLSAAPDANAYTAVGVSHDIYIIFLIQVPEEHNHGAAMSAEEMGVAPMPMGKDKVSYAFIMPQGAGLMFAMESSNKKMPSAIFALDPKEQKLQPAIPGYCDKFDFMYLDKFLMHTNNGPLKMLQVNDKNPSQTTICDKVQSYGICPPKEMK